MLSLKFALLLVSVFILCHFCDIGVESVSFDQDVSITYEQKQAIDKLRRRIQSHVVEDYMKSDIFLVKWLRSTDFDIQRAEKKLLENIRWRKDNKMATIENADFSDVSTEYVYTNEGYDKAGRPLLIAFAGDWDLRKAVVTGRVNRVLRYLDKGLEMLSRQIRELQSEGKNVTQAVLIVELSQFSVVTHGCVQCLVRLLQFLNTYESHFPGMADKVIFLDAPPAVHFIIELIRQNVSKETSDAIVTFGTNRDQWRKYLLEHVDKKYLPTEFGGTLDRN